MAGPRLRVVEPLAIAPRGSKPGSGSPETRLRALFRTEARLERRLLETRAEIGVERKLYAGKHKLGFFPPVERLRRLFG